MRHLNSLSGQLHQNSDSSDIDRDLFGWGTSGYPHGAKCYQPWSTPCFPNRYMAYGNNKNNLYNNGGKANWGFNPISNGGNVGKTWSSSVQSGNIGSAYQFMTNVNNTHFINTYRDYGGSVRLVQDYLAK